MPALPDTPATALILSLIKASVVLSLAQLIVAVTPRLAASVRHLLLTLGILAFALMPMLTLFTPAWSLEVLPAHPIPAIDVPVVRSPSEAALPPADSTIPADRSISFSTLLSALWLFGVITLAIRFAASALRLRSISRRSRMATPRQQRVLAAIRELRISKPVRLRISDQIQVPMIWGVRAGTLVLPRAAEEWSDEQLRDALIHEIGHLRRFDYLTLMAMNAIAALMWFHPQLWIARRRALIEGERACDDFVLRSGARPSDYASHLLRVARTANGRDFAGVLAMSRPSQLEGRLVAVLSPATNRKSINGRVLMIATISFLTFLVPLAAVQLSAQTATPVAATEPGEAPVVKVVAPAPPAAVTLAVPVPLSVPLAPLARTPVATRPPAPLSVAPAPAARTGTMPKAPAPEVPVEINPAPAVEPLPEVQSESAVTPEPEIHPAPAAPAAVAPEHPEAAPRPAQPSTPRVTPAPDATSIDVIPQGETTNPRVLATVKGRTCTTKLNRPVNTGDPEANPAEALALRRLLENAVKKGADAVTNVRCYREISIGLHCPAAVECKGDAIDTDGSTPKAATLSF